MIGVIAFLDAVIAGLALAAMILLQAVSDRPDVAVAFHEAIPTLGNTPEELIRNLASNVIPLTNWLVFTQFLGIAAVLAGHSVLHDRQVNTLPFLLLAPLRRFELLTGKVLGSIGMPFALYVLFSGGACAFIATLPIAGAFSAVLPPSPAWLVAFFVGGPAWAAAIGAVCSIVSTMSRDVRTAQQAVWLIVLIAQFSCGLMLTVMLPEGVGMQLAVAAAGALTAAVTLYVGSQVISRDLSR